MIDQVRACPVRTHQVRTSKIRTCQVRTCHLMVGQVISGQFKSGQQSKANTFRTQNFFRPNFFLQKKQLWTQQLFYFKVSNKRFWNCLSIIYYSLALQFCSFKMKAYYLGLECGPRQSYLFEVSVWMDDCIKICFEYWMPRNLLWNSLNQKLVV